jgi:hypothetical protein
MRDQFGTRPPCLGVVRPLVVTARRLSRVLWPLGLCHAVARWDNSGAADGGGGLHSRWWRMCPPFFGRQGRWKARAAAIIILAATRVVCMTVGLRVQSGVISGCCFLAPLGDRQADTVLDTGSMLPRTIWVVGESRQLPVRFVSF